MGSGAVETRDFVRLAGLRVDRVDLQSATARIAGYLEHGGPHQVATVNLDFLSLARRDAAFRRAINGADLAVADGMPLIWLARVRGRPIPGRVAGVDLVEACCRMAAERQLRVFILGALPQTAAAAATRLVAGYPGLRVAGTYSPSFGRRDIAEDAAIIRMIQESAPDFLFVALGAPRQDLWIREHLHELGDCVAIGVGCVVDLVAGSVRRAPRWMQRSGLEWVFRLAQEPRRLWRRYLLTDLPLLVRLLLAPTADEELAASETAA